MMTEEPKYAIPNTQGEMIDNMPILEIINHPHFYELKVLKGLGLSPDYWDITMETHEVGEHGQPLTLFGKEIPQNRYKFYKIKQS